jgi:hypothetical protein
MQNRHSFVREENYPIINDLIRRELIPIKSVYHFAFKGYVYIVDQLLQKNASIIGALAGYMDGGFLEQIDLLLARNAIQSAGIYHAAYRGLLKLVNYLLAKQADRNAATVGYAEAGNTVQVNFLLKEGVNIKHAIIGYAWAGNTEQVNLLIATNETRLIAAKAYITRGHFKQANLLTASGGIDQEEVTAYYAKRGHFEQVNQRIAAGASENSAVDGYECGGYLSKKQICRTICLSDYARLKQALIQKAEELLYAEEVDELDVKISETVNLMQNKHLSFDHAQCCFRDDTNTWLLHGTQLSRAKKLPSELYFHISSFLIGGSKNDAKNVFMVANERLHNNVIHRFNTGFLSFFNRAETVREQQALAEVRYWQRIKI